MQRHRVRLLQTGYCENFAKCILDVLWHCSPFLQTAVRGARTRGRGNCSAVLPADCGNPRRSAQSARVNSSSAGDPPNAGARAGSVHIHVIVALRDRRATCRFWYFRHRWKLRRGEPTDRPLASDGHSESGRFCALVLSSLSFRKGTPPHVLLKSAKASECTRGSRMRQWSLWQETQAWYWGPVQFRLSPFNSPRRISPSGPIARLLPLRVPNPSGPIRTRPPR